MQKIILRLSFIIYLLFLTWLIVFKAGQAFLLVGWRPAYYANLVPFAEWGGWSDIFDNVIAFIPYGLFLSALAKKWHFSHKLLLMLGTSFIYESIQFFTGFGSADITDIITNTLGGLLGLLLYQISCKIFKEKMTDRLLTIMASVIVAFLIVVTLASILWGR